ncbi:chemotaxis protein CheA, partial [bacterium]|nr:chemotaxis protein CheA [bacterium]
ADVVLKGVDILRTLVFMLKTDNTTMVIKIDDVVRQLEKLSILKKKPLETRPPKKSAISDTMDAFNNISSQQIIVLQHLGKIFAEKTLDSVELAVLHRSIKTLRDGAKKVGNNTIVILSSKLEKIINSVISENVDIEDVSDEFSELNARLIVEIQNLSESPNKKTEQVRKEPKVDAVGVTNIEKKQPKEEALTQTVSKDNIIKTMRVDSSRLDMFMNLIGELIIIRNSYSHTLSELAEQKIPNEILQELKTMESNFNRLSDGLHSTLMDIRLIPVKTVFQKIPRIIRDISRKKNKNIQFQMIGENTEIDKSIIEMIGDPLVHIVRNSCDHGIESIEQRRKAGKPEAGNIILRASHLGSAIAIDIIDDGAGIDTEKVLQLAIEKGMVSKEKAATLDNKAIYSFIFQPGFSTADEITDISGRGVGMDVVITNIKKVHGSVDIESDKGHGTQVRLLLPLTLAVVDALLLIDNNQKYAIPLESVKETIEIREKELQQLKKKEAINLRGDIIGVSRLSALLDMESKPSDPERVLSIIFLQSGQRIIGIVVDDLANQQEIVVKPLQRYLTNIPGISGSTILGNGEIILILDPSELIDLASL